MGKQRLSKLDQQQKERVDYENTFSHVVMLKYIRILLSIAGGLDYEIWQMDVKTAFLNSYLEESIFMEQPGWFKSHDQHKKVYKLLKSIYDLNKHQGHGSLSLTSLSRLMVSSRMLMNLVCTSLSTTEAWCSQFFTLMISFSLLMT